MKRFLVAFPLVLAASAHAGQAVSFSSSPISNDSNLILGWKFTVNQPLKVTGLSFFDNGLDGLANDHTVAIFDTSGVNLMQGVVPSGTSAPLDQQFRTTSSISLTGASSTVLQPGDYIVAASSPSGDSWAYGSLGSFTNYQASSLIAVPSNGALYTYTGSYFDGSGNLVAPTSHYSDYIHYFGPNLSVQAVPEPTSMAALGLGALGLLKRRKKA